jgi:flagellar hook-associated protein 1 FlgK
MSLSNALSNAFSGLTANSRAAALVSGNIANAATESYGRRSLALSAAGAGMTGGVRIDQVVRHVDQSVLADRRLADAGLGHGAAMLGFAMQMEAAVGASDAPGSLVDRLTSFENALLSSASNPASTQRLETVAKTADDLAKSLNAMSRKVQEARENADSAIAADVATLNVTVEQVDRINTEIVKAQRVDGDTASLRDARQRLIDGLSEIVPLRVVQRKDGEVALFTTGGAALLDGRPAQIEFEASPQITPDMTRDNGALSGLTLDGKPVSSERLFEGGRLAAQFAVRDGEAVSLQAALDGIARDLVERLGPGGPDTTLTPGDPGVFTDAGGAFDPLDEVGLAGRIALNDTVAPGSTDLWRLRDGLNAATRGPEGDGYLLQGMSDALEAITLPGSAGLSQTPGSFADRVSGFSAGITASRVREENENAYLSARQTSLQEIELRNGVDTDAELQRLMQIEQSYAANAQVMSSVDEMMQRLLRI